MEQAATLIFNPMAGVHDWRRKVLAVADRWQQHGWRVVLQATARPCHATQLAAAAVNAGHKLVLAAGGDGTINEVAQALVGSETILAPLPVGTANVLAKELRLPSSSFFRPDGLLEASQLLWEGRVRAVDVGRCNNGRHWLLWAGVGIDGYTVNQIEPRSRPFKRMGKLAYAAKTLSLLPNFSGMDARVTVDGESYEGEFLLINIVNGRWFAGGELYLNPQGVLDDQLFEVWLLRGTSWTQVVRSGIDIARQVHLRQKHITRARGSHIEIRTSRPQPAHLDGEPGLPAPFSVDLLPGALQLLTPAETPHGLFSRLGRTISANS